MLSFAQLLSRAPSGLYQLAGNWRSQSIDRLCRLKGVRLFHIDGARVQNKGRFLAVAADAMGFPEWFGSNWDAFHDCVTDLAWEPASAYVVLLGDMQRFATHAPRDFYIALTILEEAAQYWSDRGVSFHVLVAAGTEPMGDGLPIVSTP
jgi:RNAse (barnase) inhibitor barstar